MKGTYYRDEYGRGVGAVVEDGKLMVFVVDGDEYRARLTFDEAISFARGILELAAAGRMANDAVPLD